MWVCKVWLTSGTAAVLGTVTTQANPTPHVADWATDSIRTEAMGSARSGPRPRHTI